MEFVWLMVLLVAASAFFSFRAGQKSVIKEYLKQMREQTEIITTVMEKMSQCQDLFDDLEQGNITVTEFQKKMDQRLEQFNQKD